jgi:two-component system response regulator PilR (NtrC family)
MQVKLLRAIQEKSIRPVGSHQEENIDVRIISASHKNLSQLVEEGHFRRDLYYRINVIGIRVPPLNERAGDIELIANHILEKISKENGMHFVLDTHTLAELKNYPFPGNVRELENILERACALSENNTLTIEDLQMPDNIPSTGTSLIDKTSELEAEELEKALTQNRWNQSAAARQLGITLRQLRYRCQKLGIGK